MVKVGIFLGFVVSSCLHAGSIISPDWNKFKAPSITPSGEGKLKAEIQVPNANWNPAASQLKTVTTEGYELNTDGNKVGISEGDVCGVFFIEGKEIIVCKSGKQFDKVQKVIVGSTSTPAHLQNPKYIGSHIVERATPGMMGSGKRAIYYKN